VPSLHQSGDLFSLIPGILQGRETKQVASKESRGMRSLVYQKGKIHKLDNSISELHESEAGKQEEGKGCGSKKVSFICVLGAQEEFNLRRASPLEPQQQLMCES
jgi:hypothetical protein